MKRFALTGCLLVAFLAIMAPAAMATTYQVATVGGSGYGPFQTGVGGEFTLQVISPSLQWILNDYSSSTKNQGSTTNSFQTFCVEGGEYIYPNATYNAVLNSAAVQGGTGSSAGDPISIGTAWLYYEFATGQLVDYNYGAGRAGTSNSSAAELQNAIWWLEGEENIAFSSSNPFMEDVVVKFGLPDLTGGATGFVIGANDDSVLKTGAARDANGAYGVEVLNLTPLTGGLGQDQLVLVPEPSSLLFLGFALLTITGATFWRLRRA